MDEALQWGQVLLYPPHPDTKDSPRAIMMASRKYVDVFAAKPSDIEVGDIALGLEQYRFRRQTIVPISIVDHCLRCARLAITRGLSVPVVIACLLHDAAEAYLGDFPSPFKRYIYVQLGDRVVPFAEVEHELLMVICDALIVDVQLRTAVKLALTSDSDVKAMDHLALIMEASAWSHGSEHWVSRLVDHAPTGNVSEYVGLSTALIAPNPDHRATWTACVELLKHNWFDRLTLPAVQPGHELDALERGLDRLLTSR